MEEVKFTNFTQNESPSNEPEKMKRAQYGIQFHHEDHALPQNSSRHLSNTMPYHYNSHELDAKAMRAILTELFVKTLDTKKMQKENPHHHYEGTFVDTANIVKPPGQYAPSVAVQKIKSTLVDDKATGTSEEASENQSAASKEGSPLGRQDKERGKSLEKKTRSQENSESTGSTSAEVFREVLDKINSLGYRGKKILKKLMDEVEKKGPEGEALRRVVNETMTDQNLSDAEKKRRRRDLILSSPLHKELTKEDEDDDAAIEEVN